MLTTAAGYTVDAIGLDKAARGRRMLQDRVRGWNFRTLLRNPGFIFGGVRVFISGLPGIFAGINVGMGVRTALIGWP